MADCVVKKLLAASKNPLQGVLPVLSAYGIDIASVSVALRSKGGFIEVFKRGIETDFNIELLRLVTTYEDIELFVSVGDGEGVGEACGNEKN